MKGYTHVDLEPFPVHTLKRVDRPTTKIIDDRVGRVDERESGFNKAARGDYGKVLRREVGRFVRKQPFSAALLKMAGHMRGVVDGLAAGTKAPIPDEPALLSRHVKEAAYFLRADAVGICELPPYAVYTNSAPTGEPVEVRHKYAIAILIDQDYRASHAGSGHDWISNSMSFMSYSTSAFIACILADYIRRLGYPARAHHARNYQVVLPPILLWAGLGEMSRIGDCVLHPFLGPRFKAAVVTTDLPLVPDKPIDFGLQDFCSRCRKCARECPSGALSFEEKVMYNGYEHWPTDIRKCTSMRVGNRNGSGCGTCIKVCPWNKPYTPFHRAVGFAMRRFSLARGLAIKGDDFMGYGRPDPHDRWWFDLEEADGVIAPPSAHEDREEE
jgi:3-chloro-4-hydroxyphenylacetate reductive dehalogenase